MSAEMLDAWALGPHHPAASRATVGEVAQVGSRPWSTVPVSGRATAPDNSLEQCVLPAPLRVPQRPSARPPAEVESNRKNVGHRSRTPRCGKLALGRFLQPPLLLRVSCPQGGRRATDPLIRSFEHWAARWGQCRSFQCLSRALRWGLALTLRAGGLFLRGVGRKRSMKQLLLGEMECAARTR